MVGMYLFFCTFADISNHITIYMVLKQQLKFV